MQAKQTIAHGCQRDGNVAEDEGNGISIVDDKSAGLAKGIFGKAAQSSQFFRQHAALGEYVSHCSRGEGSDNP